MYPTLTSTRERQQLLATLATMMENDASRASFENTLQNYRTQMLLSGVQASEHAIPDVYHALEEAKKKLALLFQTQPGVCSAAITAVAFVVEDTRMNAYSYALPGKRPEIVVTSRLATVMEPAALQAIFLHELAHLLYTHSAYSIAMKIYIATYADESAVSQLHIQQLMKTFEELCIGFELTADQVMCCGMHTEEGWACISNMFATAASGMRSANGKRFLAQYGDLDMQVAQQVVAAVSQSGSHPPPLYRLKLLDTFRKSVAFAKIMRKVNTQGPRAKL
jgi:Zn-dependent protease with chaperone function